MYSYGFVNQFVLRTSVILSKMENAKELKPNMHGGDIYRNQVNIDFSVNVNPLGMPETVRRALTKAVDECTAYPDLYAEELRSSLANVTGIAPGHIICGNGASELFLAVVHGLKPRKVILPVPSFYGYEHALAAGGVTPVFYPLQEKHGYAVTDDLCPILTAGVDMLFLANPNNPTGQCVEEAVLTRILDTAAKNGICVILDECFFPLTGKSDSVAERLKAYPNLVVIRAFTKTFAIPGVRLGYSLCANEEWNRLIRMQLSEWNVSIPAQRAGVVACGEGVYISRAVTLIEKERSFLTEEISRMGIRVYPSDSNFLLCKSSMPLYGELLKKGILIRDCSSFRGLEGNGYYRIAVRAHTENERLLAAIEEIFRR